MPTAKKRHLGESPTGHYGKDKIRDKIILEATWIRYGKEGLDDWVMSRENTKRHH